MKALIIDSGILINFSMNGFLYILEELKTKTGIKILTTHHVVYETIQRPMKVPRFELGALRINQLLQNKIIELPETLNITKEQLKTKTQEFMNTANHMVKSKGKWIEIVSDAEMSCLALSKILTEKGIENIIAIDERTTRLLSEKPENLKNLMRKRLHTEVNLDIKNSKLFKGFRFLRSTELAYVAYKKGILEVKDPRALEAALYATKYKGSSVSFDEIKVLKKL